MPTKNTAEVDAILDELRNTKDANPPVLGSQLLEQERMRKKGFPVWMYHATEPPVHAANQAVVTALQVRGFQVGRYIAQGFPRTIFRRNKETIRRNVNGRMESNPKFEDCVETRIVDTQDKLDAALAEEAHRHGLWTKWALLPSHLPALDGADGEDPTVRIARLEEQLAAATQMIAERANADAESGHRRGPGRPSKE